MRPDEWDQKPKSKAPKNRSIRINEFESMGMVFRRDSKDPAQWSVRNYGEVSVNSVYNVPDLVKELESIIAMVTGRDGNGQT